MRITQRDIRLVKDIGLSHLLSRDQVINLGFFGSVTRANTRLRELGALQLVKSLKTPYFGQNLYMPGPRAQKVVGDRISALIRARAGSPRFIQHALAVTDTRIALLKKPERVWKFEQQARAIFHVGSKPYEVRPDGIVSSREKMLVVEVDLGHVSRSEFALKLDAYNAFIASGACNLNWKVPTFQVLTVTTGSQRASTLKELVPDNCCFAFNCATFEDLEIRTPGGWS